MDRTLCDKEILERSFNQPWYFEILVDRYQSAFLRKSMTVVHSKEEAEDVVQETFLRIYKYGRKFKEKEGASFKSWAYTILRNTCYSHYKKLKTENSFVTIVDFSRYDFEDATPSIQEVEKTEVEKHVESVLKFMPESFAKILKLYFLEEKSQKEIARIENVSPEAVRVRIHRAKNFFKKIITNTT